MKTATYQVDEKEILDKIFSFLAEDGLENVSIRELCRQTGIVQGSLYYWFPDKTAIICESTQYGLKKVTDEIFEYVFSSINNLPTFFASVLDRVGKYRKELRFIYQMAASPVYGEIIRNDGKYFKEAYEKYAHRLSDVLGCDVQKLTPLVYLFVSAVCNYVIWNDRDNAQTELDFIYRSLIAAVKEKSLSNKENDN